MIKPYIERFDSLTTREKIICCTTFAVIFWGAWDHFVYQPISTQKKQLSTELSAIKSQLSILQQAAIQIEVLGKTDPNQSNKQKLLEQKSQLIKLKTQLTKGEKKFVPAHLMPKVLQDILNKNSPLKLISLETIPVSGLLQSNQEKLWVFRHGLSITLSGSYFDTLHYLKALESLPWRFNWESIDYQVKEYPIAETTLRVYTLSFEENWLGL